MSRSTTKGTCELCGKSFGKAAMSRHLRTCSAPDSEAPAEGRPAFHVVVEGRYSTAYWLHLAVPVDVSLRQLDSFLRGIWLECCGHMSAFYLGKREELAMSSRAGRVLQPGMVLTYKYDFGSTTELTVKVLEPRKSLASGGAIELLARNDEPEVVCDACGAGMATRICTQCADGWLCDSCAANHKCGEEAMLPVVNSPRTGVCGYDG
jgi:hypothetical protein